MSDLSEEAERVVQDLISTDEEVPGDSWRQAREVVDELLRMLKPAERLVIRLLHLEERSTEEVSRMTGWSVALVKVRAFRARQKMRKAWGVLEARQAA